MKPYTILFTIFAVIFVGSETNIYACTTSGTPVCDAYVPHTDGCSDEGLDGKNFTTDFYGSCVSHDYCYQKIGRSRLDCDNEFNENMIKSCNDKYLKYESWLPTGEKILEWGFYCSTFFGVPYLCLSEQDVYGWVEVAKDVAEKITELPGYPLCLAAAEAYYLAVRFSDKGKDGYSNYQHMALCHAENLAHSAELELCPVMVSANEANVFSLNNDDVTNTLYMNMLGREPTTQESNESKNLQEKIDWQYLLITELSGRRSKQAALLVPILTLILD